MALTSLKEFWEPCDNTIFLGDWCVRYDTKYKNLNILTLKSFLNSSSDRNQAYKNIDDIYEKILPMLSRILNEYHDVDFSIRYWRILLGPWLITYLTSSYNSFYLIKSGIRKYPIFRTILLDKSSFVTPRDTDEFTRLITKDIYNLQLFSNIFFGMKKKFPTKKVSYKNSHELEWSGGYNEVKPKSFFKKFFEKCLTFHRYILNKLPTTKIVLSNTYFPKSFELKTTLLFFGRIYSTIGSKVKYKRSSYDHLLRSRLTKPLGNDEFLKCISKFIFFDIPICFVEDYKTIYSESLRCFPKKPKLIFSSNSWWYDEIFKFWAARSSEKGVPLCGTPHSDFGTRLLQPSVNHELNITDFYFSWGWYRQNSPAKIIPMPATRFIDTKQINADNNKNGILMVSTIVPRYVSFEFPFNDPSLFMEYLNWQKLFLGCLNDPILKELTFRPHPLDYGWSVSKRINDFNKDIIIDTFDKSIYELMNENRICICDHLSTSVAQSFAANNPTIIFWSEKNNELTDDAKKSVESLKKVGIFFDSPEGAAMQLNNIYDDIESWWLDSDRQKTVKMVVKDFFNNSTSSKSEWHKKIRESI